MISALKQYKIFQIEEPLLYSILIQFLIAAISLTSMAYITGYFLTSFSPENLVYLFLFEFIGGTGILVYLIKLFQNKNTKKTCSMLLVTSAILLAIIITTINSISKVLLLLFCAFVYTQKVFISTVSMNSIKSILPAEEYKRNTTKLCIASSLGMATTAFVLLFSIDHYGLFSCGVILLLLVTCIFLLYNKYYYDNLSYTKKKIEKNLWKECFSYKILIYFISFSLLIPLLLVIFEYQLKTDLYYIYPPSSISKYLILLTALCSILGLPIQYFSSKFILEKYGSTALLLILPFAWLVSIMLMAIYPGIVSSTIAFSAHSLLYYTFTSSGKELILLSIPKKLQQISRPIVKIFNLGVGYLISSILLIYIQKYLILKLPILFLLDITLIIVAYIIGKEYAKSFFQQLAQLGEYYAPFADFRSNKALISYFVGSLFKKKHNVSLYFEEIFKLIKFSDEILSKLLLNNFNDLINSQKARFVRFLTINNKTGHGKKLLSFCENEHNENIKYEIFNYLVNHSQSLAEKNIKFLKDNLYQKIISQRLKTVNSDINNSFAIIDDLKNVYEKLSDNEKENISLAMCDIKTIVGNPFLKLMINQKENDKICFISMQAACDNKATNLLPDIIDQLYADKRRSFASYILGQCREYAVNKLIIELFKASKINIISTLISKLSLSNKIEAAQALLIYYKNTDNFLLRHKIIQNIAINFNLNIINELLKFQIYEFMKYSCYNYIINLYNWIKISPKFSQHEIELRIILIKEIFLYFFIIYSKNKQILPLVDTYYSLDSETRYSCNEFIISLSDTKIRPLVKCLQIVNKPNLELLQKIYPIDDMMLYVIKLELSKGNELMEQNGELLEKLQNIRKCVLFSKLPVENILTISSLLVVRKFISGEYIFYKGDFPDGIYLHKEGKLIFQEKNTPVNQFQLFGEVSVISNKHRIISVLCKTEAICYFIPKAQFISLVKEHPAILIEIISQISKYLYDDSSSN